MRFANRADMPVATIKVSVQNSPRQFEAIADLQTAIVTDDIEAPSMFELKLASWDTEAGDFTWLDEDLFDIGNAIEIHMGYGNEMKSLISGEITGLEPEFSPSSPPTLTIRGHDLRHRLMRGQKTRSFTKMKLSDVAQQVIQGLNLKNKITDTSVKLDYVLQHNQTDLEFLQTQARRIGYEVMMIDKTLHFRPQQYAQSKVLTLSPKADQLEFSPRLSTIGQISQVRVRGWNPKEEKRQKQAITHIARANQDEGGKMGGTSSGSLTVMKEFGQASYSMVTQPIANKAEAEQLAKAYFIDQALNYITGEGTCAGRTDLRAGSVIEIVDIGRRFSGLYYVVSAVHTYVVEQGYSTQFTVRRNAS
jgi:uncharacterized protein